MKWIFWIFVILILVVYNLVDTYLEKCTERSEDKDEIIEIYKKQNKTLNKTIKSLNYNLNKNTVTSDNSGQWCLFWNSEDTTGEYPIFVLGLLSEVEVLKDGKCVYYLENDMAHTISYNNCMKYYGVVPITPNGENDV